MHDVKAAIYLRVSTDDQDVEAQRLELAGAAERLGFEPEEFVDVASGAKSSRAGLDRMMAAVRAGRIKAVFCVKLDRLGRSLTHLAQMMGEFDAAGCALVCPSQGIDTRADSPAGRLQMHVLAAVAEFERSLIRERTKAGLRAAASKGRHAGRPAFKPDARKLRDLRAAREAGPVSVSAAARLLGCSRATARAILADKEVAA